MRQQEAGTPELQPELTEAAEAWHWLSSYGDQVWPGWGAARIPLLIRAGEFDLLVGHPSPPQGFSLLPGATVARQSVYRYASHLVPASAATAWEVGGVWSVAVPAREEFQQAIDARLGKGVVHLATVNYVRAIVHEAFHAYAMAAIRGKYPTLARMMQLIARAGEMPGISPAAEKTWLDFHMALSYPAGSPDGFRGRYYLLGAGQAFLVDRLMPDWKTRVFDEKLSLEELLREALQ